MFQESEILQQLACNINIGEINTIVNWASGHARNLEVLFGLIKSPDDRTGRNALWCLTHCQQLDGAWLQTKQNELIDMLLI